jgi:Ser/Thr protein kinase RdoA (MazF antagonist)
MTRLSSRTSAEAPEGSAAIFGVGSLRRGGTVISEPDAQRLAAAYWGIEGIAGGLAAEVDENFRLAAAAGPYLLKVVPVDEQRSLTDLVTAALQHVAARGEVEVQRVVPTRSGAPLATFVDADGCERRARLTTFLDGRTLSSLALDADLRRRLGETLARLAGSLRDFEHPGADRDLSWDLRHAGRMQAMLDELGPGSGRAELAECLARFDAETVPRLDRLPAQIVHNDLSRDNAVLTDEGRIGAIDFGDIVRTQRVNDLAVAMADQLEAGPEPFAPALDLAAGYAAVAPLEEGEAALLYELARVRVATRIVGGEWRAGRFPENREYLARNVERLWTVFSCLPERPTDADARRLAEIGADR